VLLEIVLLFIKYLSLFICMFYSNHIRLAALSKINRENKNVKYNISTVKPVYSGHLGKFDKMTTIDR
jgi:hypothetical protein